MITLKEFLSFFRGNCRVRIFDFSLIEHLDFDDWVDVNDPIVYFGFCREVPDDLLSRAVNCSVVSNEYLNCLCIELKKKGDLDGKQDECK